MRPDSNLPSEVKLVCSLHFVHVRIQQPIYIRSSALLPLLSSQTYELLLVLCSTEIHHKAIKRKRLCGRRRVNDFMSAYASQ